MRLPFLLRQSWTAVLVLAVVAVAANQSGLDFVYGARFYLGSVPAVLALLLLGRRGLWVGGASVLLVPRLWAEPQVALLLFAELCWLAAFLLLGEERTERCERGDVVLADLLFWSVLALPLALLLLGVIANDDLTRVFDASLLLAVNGCLNTAIAYGIFLLIRIAQSRRHPEVSLSLQGLLLISLLGLTLATGMVSLALGLRQLDVEVLDDHLARYRQLAVTSAALELDALDALSGLRRQQSSPLDFQVLDRNGSILYDTNPALFQTLERRYVEPAAGHPRHPPVDEPLDLLIPVESPAGSLQALRGYWRYQSADEPAARAGMSAAPVPERMVVVVEPAWSGLRELQTLSSQAIRQLALVTLVGVVAARGLSRFVVRQVPDLPRLQGFRAEDDRSAGVSAPAQADASPPRDGLHSGLRELQPLLHALRSRGDVLVNLRESYRRSERQRSRLEAEVGRLNIVDPLTGCFNRRELYRRLDHELRLSEREARELSFLCLEIDHLRHIQTSYGKSVQEEVLRCVATELRHRSRSTDFLCRLGHEQFGLLLPACDAVSAGRVAQLLRDAVRSREIHHEGSILSVTLSVGVACFQPSRDDPDSLITRAQSALYRAKAEGRDRVVVA